MDRARPLAGQLVSLLAHCTAGLLFALRLRTLDFPPSFNVQLLAALGISAVLTLATLAVKRQSWLLGLLGLQFFVALVIDYPMGESVDIELVLFAGLLILCSQVLNAPADLLFPLAVIAGALLSQRTVLAWGRHLRPPPASGLLLLGAILCMLLPIVLALKGMGKRYRRERERNRQLDSAVEQLTSANLGFQEYASATEEMSRLSERERITREIHDVVGYTLTNITMMMEDAIDWCRQGIPGEILPLIVNTRDQARNGHEEIRQALYRLRSIAVSGAKGVNAIHRLVKTFEKATGVQIGIEYTNLAPGLSEEMEHCLYRLIQEGMTNAFQHGQATFIRIVLGHDGEAVVLSVSDNGVGSGEIFEGMGITGMRERVRRLGGEIRFESTREGFRFIARIPSPAGGQEV